MKPSSTNSIVAAAVATASTIAISSAAMMALRSTTKKQQQRQASSSHHDDSLLQRTVVITGGCGNLATKLATHLLAQSQSNDDDDDNFSYRVILIEHPDFFVQERVPDGAEIVLSDLLDGSCDAKWRKALKGAYAVVHFSAVNPYLNATWKESADSMMHNFSIVLASIDSNVDRFIFASSSHVMGGYKEEERSQSTITTDDPPMCGTFFRNPKDLEKSGNGVAYAAAKLAGEQICRAVAASQICKSSSSSSSTTTAVIALRIGWCQPGENLPSTLSAGGVPDEYRTKGDNEEDDGDEVDDVDDDNNNNNEEGSKAGSSVFFDTQSEEDYVDDGHDEKWFTNMWLSNQDFLTLFTAAIEKKDLPRDTFTVVNAMSNNEGMRWSLEKTVNVLGVMPKDDSRAKGS